MTKVKKPNTLNWCLELVSLVLVLLWSFVHRFTLWYPNKAVSDRLSSSCGYISSGSRSPQGKPEEAEALCARAIEIQEKALGPDHPDLVPFLTGRATLLQRQVGAPPVAVNLLVGARYTSLAFGFKTISNGECQRLVP